MNGFRFHTHDLESKRTTQNSGVMVRATTSSFSSSTDQNPITGEVAYYGVLQNIIELDYNFDRKVVLLDCDWVSQGNRIKQDEDGFTMVQFSNLRPNNEPYILSSQAKQVFYVADPTEKGWQVAISSKARDEYDMDPIENVDTHLQSEVGNIRVEDDTTADLSWLREDAPGCIVET